MTGKRFSSAAVLVALLLSTGCRCWCEKHYPCPPAYPPPPPPAGYAPQPCVPCVPCCPPGTGSGYAPAPPPSSWTAPRGPACCP
jgi:hypothetical protein